MAAARNAPAFREAAAPKLTAGSGNQERVWCYGQPAAYAVWKQMKSLTLSTGGVVLPSQFAAGFPAAKLFKKQVKSLTFKTGATVDPSQLA